MAMMTTMKKPKPAVVKPAAPATPAAPSNGLMTAPRPATPTAPTVQRPTATTPAPAAPATPAPAAPPAPAPAAPVAPPPAPPQNGLGTAPTEPQPGDPTYTGYEDSTEVLVNEMASQDSLLMQQAATSGLQTANDRGMINSSMSAGAAQAATLDYIVPIASQDASQNFTKNMSGLETQQELVLAEFDRETQAMLQKTQIMADAMQAELDRELALEQQASEQGFEAEQLETQLAFEAAQTESQQAFEASQAAAQQAFEQELLASDQAFSQQMAEFEAEQAAAAQAFEASLQDDAQDYEQQMAEFAAQQEAEQRAFEQALIEDSQQFEQEMAEFEAQQLEEQRAFEAQQAELDRQIQTALAEMDLEETDQAAATAMITDAWSDYNAMYAEIMSNPDLSAEEREAQILTNQEMLDDRITYTTELYNVAFDWPENVWDV
jgi:hypothetical protein